MKNNQQLAFVIICFVTNFISAQGNTSEYLNHNWKYVATKMPSEWYGSNDAKLVAENVMVSQKKLGGWEKNKEYHKPFTKEEREHYIIDKNEVGGTFDNGSTITELRFLAKVYSQTKDQRIKKAFEKGLNFITISQYQNGGWPQFYPIRPGKVDYSGHITYNDNAMVNIMKFLKEIYTDSSEYSALQLSDELKIKAQKEFDKGIECILKTQIIVKDSPTVWCAQHDQISLKPANARAYELASFSGGESVGLVMMLMDIENPSKEISKAVNGAVNWFETHKIEGIKLETITQADGQKDLIVVEDKNAPRIWARFYDLETEKPYFCDRDGIKRNTFAEMGYNRRNGYGWYTYAPEKVFQKYAEWKIKNKLN